MTMGRVLQAVPSDRIVQSAVVERGLNLSSFAKSKEIVITFAGEYRIKFILRLVWAADKYAYATIYRNGTAIGTPRRLDSAGPVQYVENIGGWSQGDLCQLWGYYSTSGYVGYVSGFAVCAEYGYVPPPIPKGLVTVDS